MIELKDLYALKEENEKHINDMQAENRVLDKLIELEKSKYTEQPIDETQEYVEENSTN